jgi:hypothetical protein
MNKKFMLGFIICFLLSIVIVYATVMYRVPTVCIDSDGNCDFTNINASDSINETVNLKTCEQALEAGCNVTATTFNGTIPGGSVINNVTIYVKWSNDDDGAGNQSVGYYNGTWIDCAGRFGENTGTYVNTYCTDQQGNFSTVDSINNIQIRFRGNDTDGAAPAEARIDIMDVEVDYSAAADTSFLVMMPSAYSGAGYNYTITAETEETANETAWISFNITAFCTSPPYFPCYNVEPYRQGDSSDNQVGNGKPIFYIDNIGNTNINISLRLNESFPLGINISANASCTGTYTSCDSTKTLLDTSYSLLVHNLSDENSFANISLWGDFNVSATPGETFRGLFTKSTQAE